MVEMQNENTEQSKMAAAGSGSGQALAKANAFKSRMKKRWRIIRARHRSTANRASGVGLHSFDRSQMSLYVS